MVSVMFSGRSPASARLSCTQSFQAEFSHSASVQLVERIAHATGLSSPELRIESLDLLQLRIKGCRFASESDECRMLRLQG